MSASAQLPLRCWAEIDLAALERNLKLIRASLPPHIRYVAVVKADAYGHGLPHTAARLMHAGADLLAVANIAEAMALRELSGNWPVLLLSATLPDEDRYLAELDHAATVSSAAEVERFAAVGRAAGRPVAVHLKIDTGMGRLGVWHEQARALYELIRATASVRLAGIYIAVKTRGRWPWMLLGALLVPAGQFAGSEGPMFIIVNLGEVLMSAAMVGTLAYVMRRERAAQRGATPPTPAPQGA